MKKSLFLLAGVYLAGVAITLRYGRSSAEDHDSASECVGCPESSSCPSCCTSSGIKGFTHDVVDIHQRAWNDFEAFFLNEDTRMRLRSYRDRLFTSVADFHEEARERLDRIRTSGGDFSEILERELRDLYRTHSDRLRDVRSRSEGILAHAGERGQRIWEEARSFLDDTYADIRCEFFPTKTKSESRTDTDSHN